MFQFFQKESVKYLMDIEFRNRQRELRAMSEIEALAWLDSSDNPFAQKIRKSLN